MFQRYLVLVMLMLFFGINAGYGQYPSGGPFNFNCAYDSSFGSPLSSLDDDTLGVLVIIARGWGGCMGQSNDPLPAWANRLFDANDPQSLTKFYDDNSHGQVHLIGTVARHNPDDDSCFYTEHIPCNAAWGSCGCFCLYDSACACTSVCEYSHYFADICQQVDAATDLSQYDRTGPNGVPDGVVDFVLWINYPWGNQGFGGLGESYTSQSDGETISAGVTMWGGNNYFQVLSLAAHEVGHAIGHGYAPDWTHTGLTNYNHLAIGGFDVMSAGGFGYDDSVAYPSLFNPWSRGGGLRWTPVDTVTSSSFDLALQPYCDSTLSYANQGTCYRLASTADANQYFLVTSHNRSSFWETYWPTAGVLSWRVNTNTWANSMAGRANRKLKIESGTGFWNWDIVGQVHEQHDVLDVAVRSDTANAAGGYDSLDFQYTRRQGLDSRMFAADAGYLGWGGVGQFFQAGMSMDDHTNPTSRMKINQSPDYPRTTNSGIALRNIRETQQHNFIADLIVNAWQGTMTQNHTWFDTVRVVGNLTVASGATLTIQAGTKILADSGVTITVSGSLHVNGTSQDSVRFMAAPGVTQWGGIHIVQGGYADVSFAVIKNAFLPFWSQNAGVSDIAMQLKDSRIIGGGNGLRIWGSSTRTHLIERVTVQDIPNVSTYAALYFLNTKVVAVNLNVLRSGNITGYVDNSTGSCTNCVFSGAASYYGMGFHGSTTGMVFKCCDFDHISPVDYPSAAVWCIGGAAPIFGQGGTPPLNNRITDKHYCLVRFYGGAGRPTLGGANNILVQEHLDLGYKFMVWDSVGNPPYKAKNIYWGGVTPQLADFEPAVIPDWDYSSYLANNPGLCGGVGGTMAFESAFESALALEEAEQWTDAQAAYLTIAGTDSYATGDRTAAAARAVMVDRETQALTISDVNSLSTSLQADASDLTDTLGIERVRLCHLTDEAEYSDAVSGYEDLIDRGLSEQDSLLTVMDILQVQLLAETGGGHLDAAVTPRHTAYVVHSATEGVQMVNAAMDALTGHATGHSEHVIIPTTYKLYQNYPNPFNPTTEIKFDLPEAVKVQLKIFNTLGQEVTTLIDESRPAGAYRVEWNATGVASGLYVYQLKAGSFVAVRKMLLIR